MTRYRTGPAVIIAVGVLLTAGCASAASSTAPTQSAPGPVASTSSGAATLTISGFTFSSLSVRAGALITVVNQDQVPHTVDVHGTAIDVSVAANGRATFTAPAAPGSYPLTCDIHPAMHGTLQVTA